MLRHVYGFGKWELANLDIFGFPEIRLTLRQVFGDKHEALFIGNRIAGMQLHQLRPAIRDQSCFLPQFALRGSKCIFVLRRAAHRQFPGILSERVAVLPNDPGIASFIQRQDGDCPVLEAYDAVVIFTASGIDDVILGDGNPGILEHDPGAELLPAHRRSPAL